MSVKQNLILEQGTTFSVLVNAVSTSGANLNLTGYTGNSQMRKWYNSSNVFTFNVSIDSAHGNILLQMDSNTTMNINAGQYVYDIKLTSPIGVVTRFMEGIVQVTPQVTGAVVVSTGNSFNDLM